MTQNGTWKQIYTENLCVFEKMNKESRRWSETQKNNIRQSDLDLFIKKYTMTDEKLSEDQPDSVCAAIRREDKRQVRVKKIKLKRNKLQWIFSRIKPPKEIRYLNLMKDVDSCVKLLDVYMIEDEWWIITESIGDSVTLKEFIGSRKPLSEPRVAHIFRQIVAAVLDIEKAGVAHRDLKCGSILINQNDNIQVTNFGAAVKLGKANKNVVCTPGYIAPEVELKKRNYAIGPVTTWSLGITLASLLIGEEPFEEGLNACNVKQVILYKMMKSQVSSSFQDLVFKCLDIDAVKRPSVSDILQRLDQLIIKRNSCL
ncbi:uncharacterized protein LOC136041907 [Artemia franciscana]|uniref:uncharacterized protein LOC136041907 n=1 Tax=Artemia franciscana TaxID=6661 RepID=UPI0032DB1551